MILSIKQRLLLHVYVYKSTASLKNERIIFIAEKNTEIGIIFSVFVQHHVHMHDIYFSSATGILLICLCNTFV